jgi:hypothetical protein
MDQTILHHWKILQFALTEVKYDLIFITSMQKKFAQNNKDDIQGNAQGLLYLIAA